MGPAINTIKKILRRNGVPIRPRQLPDGNFRRHVFTTAYFREIDTEAKAYWLGFLCADSHIWRGIRVEIGLAATDRGHLVKLQAAVGSAYQIIEKEQPPGFVGGRWFRARSSVRMGLNSKTMVADLARHGVVAGGLRRLFPFHLSPALRRHYFRGLFDGDGGICPNRVIVRGAALRDQWSMSQCGSHSCVEAFAAFARAETGTAAQVSENRTSKGLFCFAVHGNKVSARLAHALYSGSTTFLDRKLAKYHELISSNPV